MSGRLVSLGEVTASMAHEFNNPLGIIMGFVEDMLSSRGPADPDYRSLQIIDEESKRCRQIVKNQTPNMPAEKYGLLLDFDC